MLPTLLLVLLGVAAPATLPAEANDDVETVAAWLTGDFSSAEQAVEDGRYFAIELHVRPIWVGREDGPWLYVEQAAAQAVERPYRQRVYRILANEAQVASVVYTLPGDPLRFAGKYRTPEACDVLSPDDLVLREGCTVYLTREGNAFVGATRGAGCRSTLAGAAYATSEVALLADEITSWDRGYDQDGTQVWGAEAGPYVFKRLEP
ncbi:MAG: chromophore lyase CpcT/CpeT [Planctomycetota bacterium]